MDLSVAILCWYKASDSAPLGWKKLSRSVTARQPYANQEICVRSPGLSGMFVVLCHFVCVLFHPRLVDLFVQDTYQSANMAEGTERDDFITGAAVYFKGKFTSASSSTQVQVPPRSQLSSSSCADVGHHQPLCAASVALVVREASECCLRCGCHITY